MPGLVRGMRTSGFPLCGMSEIRSHMYTVACHMCWYSSDKKESYYQCIPSFIKLAIYFFPFLSARQLLYGARVSSKCCKAYAFLIWRAGGHEKSLQ